MECLVAAPTEPAAAMAAQSGLEPFRLIEYVFLYELYLRQTLTSHQYIAFPQNCAS
jgi:hypothetical protein